VASDAAAGENRLWARPCSCRAKYPGTVFGDRHFAVASFALASDRLSLSLISAAVFANARPGECVRGISTSRFRRCPESGIVLQRGVKSLKRRSQN
jgi:hypothetical protein